MQTRNARNETLQQPIKHYSSSHTYQNTQSLTWHLCNIFYSQTRISQNQLYPEERERENVCVCDKYQNNNKHAFECIKLKRTTCYHFLSFLLIQKQTSNKLRVHKSTSDSYYYTVNASQHLKTECISFNSSLIHDHLIE